MEKYNPDGICQGVYVTEVLKKEGMFTKAPSTKSGLMTEATFLSLKQILECAATYVNTTERKVIRQKIKLSKITIKGDAEQSLILQKRCNRNLRIPKPHISVNAGVFQAGFQTETKFFEFSR
jgi:hypothetical protein